MKVLTLLKMVPDTVGELPIGTGGNALDYPSLRMVPNESDEHALEQALLLKERYGVRVTLLALDAPGLDDVLLTALAKGADRAIKITGVPLGLTSNQASDIFARVISGQMGLAPADLILTGVQAIDDLDGLIAPLIACKLGLPFIGTVTNLSLDPDDARAIAVMEYPGGVKGEFEVAIPAVLGIRAAAKPPRYVSIAKVREMTKSRGFECIPAPLPTGLEAPAFEVLEMRKPQAAPHAQVIKGPVEAVSARLAEVLEGRDLI